MEQLRKKIIMKYNIILIAAAMVSSACVVPASTNVHPVFKPLGNEKASICIVGGIPSPEMKKLNYFKDSWQIVSPCEVELSAASTAVAVFYYMWEKEFGDPDKKVFNSLNKMTVEWGEEYKVVKAGYDIDGKRRTDLKVSGLTLSKSYIWVKRNPRNYIYRTSFAHELVHTSLWATQGTPDANHELATSGNKSNWTPQHTKFIKKVNSMLWSLGI